MTNFLHWRKTTWALGIWSAVLAIWLVAGNANVFVVVGLWLAGVAALGILWFSTQPLFRRGRGLGDGFFVKPRAGDWRILNLHRTLHESEGRRARTAPRAKPG
jgi:hypothetical protein